MKKVIQARNVSKKYQIFHEHSAYQTIVETVTGKAKRLYNRLKNPLTQLENPLCEEFWALKGVDLDIVEGDRVGIVGRNGAGKSTLLKVLAKITHQTSGTIQICGRVSSLLEVGTGFHPELTGRENIFLNGAILGMKRREIIHKFDDIVAFAEVEKFLDTPVKRYSSGMYTRLGFAIAAHLDAELLIVDEVLAVGDMQFQKKCLKKLDDLSSHGRTILFVSHDMGSILTLCNKGLLLDQGKVREFGPIEQCINSYIQTCRLHGLMWEGNEGDDCTRFYKAAIKSCDGVRDFFYQGEKAHFEIEYELLKPLQDFVIGIGVLNQRSQLIARAHTSDDAVYFADFNRPGRHKAVFEIDASLFHEGEYRVRLDSYVHGKKRILSDQVVLKFQVFAPQKHTRYSHGADRDGIFLGNRWRLESNLGE